MAIQPVDLGAPVTGVGGDDYRQAHTKINANFVEVGADIVALKAKDATQDTAINLKAVKTEVTTALGLKADVSDVNAKNATQDSAINLRATISSVDAKNATQDAAITAAQDKADAAIPKSEKGVANGVATLDVDGKISPLQIPTEQPIAWGNITGDITDQIDLVSSIPELAKTPLTYTETTVEPPNLAVDSEGTLKRSTATFGTAATKDAGYANGEVALINYSGVANTGIGTFFSPSATSLPRYLKSGNYNYPESSSHFPPNLNRYDTQCLVLSKHAQGYGTAIWFPYGIASANNIVLEAFAASTRVFHTIYTDKNTTKDTATGFIKASSPVLHVYNDSITKIHEAEQLDITVDKKGVGHYEIHGTTGLRKNDGWFMSPPRDVHGNILCMVDLDEKDGVIILKTYKKKFDFETVSIVHDWDSPMDIPVGVCVEFRFNNIPQEQLDEPTE